MAQPLLEGNIDNRDALIEQLQEEVAELKRELRVAQAETAQAKRAGGAAVSALRHQLEPFYRALKSLFGELDKFEVVDVSPEGTKTSAVWEAWKSRLGRTAAKCIDALLTHRELNTQQLAIAAGLNRNTIPNIIYALNKAGLINKNGGRFSLKEL